MKPILSRILPVFAALVGLLLLSGCASPSAGGALTLKQIKLDVDWKMTTYQQVVPTGNVTTGQSQQVASAYQSYQVAFQQALKAAQGNLDTPSPANLQQQANQLIGVVDSVLATVP